MTHELSKDGHTVSTSIAAEATQLRAKGYRPVTKPKAPAHTEHVHGAVEATKPVARKSAVTA